MRRKASSVHAASESNPERPNRNWKKSGRIWRADSPVAVPLFVLYPNWWTMLSSQGR
jgi:hypothetical protein